MALSGLGTTQINGVAPMTLNTPTRRVLAATQFTNGTINGAGNLSIRGNATYFRRAIVRRHGDGDRRLRRHPHVERPGRGRRGSGQSMVVQGTLTVNDTNLFGQAGTLTNDGVVNMEGASPVMVQQGQTTWSFDNKGTLNSSSTGTATIQAPITTSMADVNLKSGDLTSATAARSRGPGPYLQVSSWSSRGAASW